MKGSKNQRKPVTKPTGRGKKRNKKASDGKIKSSSALEYLMQRESQITNMLKGLEEEEKEQGDGWIRNEENKKPYEVAPDKKLKTSAVSIFVLVCYGLSPISANESLM